MNRAGDGGVTPAMRTTAVVAIAGPLGYPLTITAGEVRIVVDSDGVLLAEGS